MTPRHWLMLAGVLGAGALLLFGERQPVAEVAEAVERAVAPARHAAAKPPAAQPAILALLPRSEVAGEDGDTLPAPALSSRARTGIRRRRKW